MNAIFVWTLGDLVGLAVLGLLFLWFIGYMIWGVLILPVIEWLRRK